MTTQTHDPVEQAATASLLDVGKYLRVRLIRKFQRGEGNLDCCASAYTRVCKQFECLWRNECQALMQDEDLLHGGHE